LILALDSTSHRHQSSFSSSCERFSANVKEARLHLRIRDVPVHYKERVYGSTNISRFRHGALLLRMTLVAARKLRFV
jgi:hypothetical protein